MHTNDTTNIHQATQQYTRTNTKMHQTQQKYIQIKHNIIQYNTKYKPITQKCIKRIQQMQHKNTAKIVHIIIKNNDTYNKNTTQNTFKIQQKMMQAMLHKYNNNFKKCKQYKNERLLLQKH